MSFSSHTIPCVRHDLDLGAVRVQVVEHEAGTGERLAHDAACRVVTTGGGVRKPGKFLVTKEKAHASRALMVQP